MGREILAALLADERYAAIHTIGRRAPPITHPRLTHHSADFAALPALPPLDDVFIALGTTIKVAGSQSAFEAVDLQAVAACAQHAVQAGATRLGVVSALGARADSRVFYNRVKGQMEQAVARIGAPVTVFARPSLLLGDRAALGQPVRAGEQIGARVMRFLAPLIPLRWHAISARDVALSLIEAVQTARPGVLVLHSQQLQRG